MGSPRIHQDELSGGLIIAPGSETTASVSEPLADIAGGKSGTDAEIENPYDQMPTAGPSSGTADSTQGAQQQLGQGSSMHGQSGVDASVTDKARSEEQAAKGSPAAQGNDEYSEQQQSQQASSGCKQS